MAGQLHAGTVRVRCARALDEHLGHHLDRRIHRNYRIYPGNYVAYDWLNGTTEFASNYTEEEKLQFMNYIEQQLAKIKIPNKDEDFLREKLLLMYSNPLVNYLAACR